ncbi:MAG: hypothetical protein ACI9LM_001885 [Alteromonadaceae bacterium]|jgi:hypothetical protein
MKEQATFIFRMLALLGIAIILQACGGSDKKAPTYSISANVSNVSFSNQFLTESTESIKISVNFEGNGLLVGYAPDVQQVGWLNFRTENVTATSADIYVDIVNANNITADLYNTKIRLSTGDVVTTTLVHHDIDVSLLIWKQLTFTDTFGVEVLASQSFEFSNENQLWSVSADVDWLTVETIFNSETQKSTVTLTPTVAALPASGLYQGNLVYSGRTGNSKQAIDLGLDNLHLYADKPVIAFTATKNIHATEQIITIATNSLTPVNWTATTSTAWLSIIPIPDSNQIRVVANPELAANNVSSMGTIVIAAVDDDSVQPEIISVDLYKSELTTNNSVLSNIAINDNAMTISPKHPQLYLGVGNELRVYHQYSSELIATITVSPENTLLEQLIVHPQGNLLLAKAVETRITTDVDGIETEKVTIHRYKIDLSNYTVRKLENSDIQNEPIKFVRLKGRYFIITQAMEFADENLIRQFWDGSNAFFVRAVDVAQKTGRLFALDASTSEINRFTAKVNDFTTRKLTTEKTHSYRPERLADNDAIRDFFVTADEKSLYLYSPTSEWLSFNGTDFIDNGLLETNNKISTIALNKSSNDRPHYIRIDQSTPETAALGIYVDVYDEQQTLSATIHTQGQVPSNSNISADDKKLVIQSTGLTNGQQIELVNLSQFELSAERIAFEINWGNDKPASQDVTLSGIGENWQVSSNIAWLVITPSTIDGIDKVNLAIDMTTITTWGLYSGAVTVFDPASGTSSIISVDFAIDETRLFANYPSLTFNSQVDQSILSHTVQVLTNNAANIAWQATSDLDWLSVTANTTNNTLTLTADPSKVTTNGLHYGQVILSPLNSGESITGVIEVSFNKGTYDTSSQDEITIDNITPNSAAIVLDPLRPYIYIAQADSIDVYNIVNGSKVTSIASPLADIDLTNLVIHPNGTMLLASNTETYTDENKRQQNRINHYAVNLNDFSIALLSDSDISIQYRPKSIAMVSGKPVVVTQALEYANLALTRQYWDTDNLFVTSTISDVKSNNNIIAHDQVSASLLQQTLQYNAFAKVTTTVTNSNVYINPDFANAIGNITASSDGSAIYTANSLSEWSSFDGSDFVDQGVLHNTVATAVNIETDSSDNSYLYRFDFSIGFFILSKYDKNQQALWTVAYSAGSANSYISTNYQRMIHYNATAQSLVLDYIQN